MSRIVNIYCKPSLLDDIKSEGLGYSWSQQLDEINVLVEDIFDLEDDQLCEHYGLDYDQVNCVEAHNFVA